MYGCNSMLEWCGLFSGVKTFNFRSIHLVSFEGSSRGTCVMNRKDCFLSIFVFLFSLRMETDSETYDTIYLNLKN